MAATIPTVELSNGVKIPVYGAGTGFLDKDRGLLAPEEACKSVTIALDAGVRHIDAALAYRTQNHIANILRKNFTEGYLERKNIFLTSKVFQPFIPILLPSTAMPSNQDSMTPDEVTTIVRNHFEQCIVELGVGYIDLMLLHWPATINSQDVEGNRSRRLAAWKVLEEMYEKGFATAIGVSNFNEIHLTQLKEDGAKIQPMVNQIEASPYVQYDKIIDYCKENNIVVEAYSPLSGGTFLSDPAILSLVRKYKKDAGQICLKYLIQRGYVVVVRSQRRHHSNIDIFDFELSEDDMNKIIGLNKGIEGSSGLTNPYSMA